MNNKPTRGARILVVDDDKVSLKILNEALTMSGFEPSFARTYQGALALVETGKYELFLLDINLPDGSGLDICRQLKADPAFADTPVLFISGNDDPEDVAQGLSAGGVDYIKKPFRLVEVMARVEVHLKLSRTQKELAAKKDLLEREIGARDAAEQELILYNWALSEITDGIIVTTGEPDFTIYVWNRGAAMMYGYSKSEAVGASLRMLRTRATDSSPDSDFLDSLEQCHEEVIQKRKDGEAIVVDLSTTSMRNDRGEKRWVHVARDITERKSIQGQRLQESKLESIGQLAAGIAHEINTPTQYVGDNLNFLRDVFEDITTLIKHYRVFASDQQQGMSKEALDEIEVEIGLDELLDEIPDSIGQSLEGVARVASIVKAMKEFSHPGSSSKEPADINRAIESTVTVARNEWKYAADLELRLDSSLLPVECFLGDVNQAVLNLVVNAAHAIQKKQKDIGQDGKGRIVIETATVGKYLQITVSDTGCGIPDEDKKRIFDPFFTTKPVGKGTGQGLSLVHSVAKKHGGSVTVESEVGVGTTFVFRIPLGD